MWPMPRAPCRTALRAPLVFPASGDYNSRTISESRMFSFASRFGLGVLLATLCLGAPAAHAQASPLSYWTPGWPMGFGGTDVDASTYANFPSFTATDARGFAYQRFDLGNGWFMGN